MKQIRVIHYINQFFGKIGGEDMASIPPRFEEGPVGIGEMIVSCSEGDFQIVRTIICGDNFAAENLEEFTKTILPWIEEVDPDLLIAGPAFAAGRYGTACGILCQEVHTKLGIPVLSAMHPLNPGVDLAKKDIFILETGDSAREIARVVPRMVSFARKLVLRAEIGSPEEEGYIPRGIRINVRDQRRGSRRAVEMLINKLEGTPFETELPMPVFDRVPPAPAISVLSEAVIAIATEGGIVPQGNPDRIEAHNASKWCRYPISDISRLEKGRYEVAHGGYDPVPATDDPNRVLPLDAARVCEQDGLFSRLYDYYPVTVGNVTAVRSAEKYGREIGEMLKKDGVQGVILTST